MSGYRTQSRDTDARIERLLIEHLRSLSAVEKVALVRAACKAAETWTRAGLRLRHPDADEAELRLRAGAQRLGPEVVREVYGFEPDENPR